LGFLENYDEYGFNAEVQSCTHAAHYSLHTKVNINTMRV
jgi:hypothetical protein